jgi:hypothetical protein
VLLLRSPLHSDPNLHEKPTKSLEQQQDAEYCESLTTWERN